MEKTWHFSKALALGLIVAANFGCAGPTSPFGSLEFGSGDGYAKWSDGKKQFGDLQAYPRRQVLHKSTPLKLEVKSPSALPSDVQLQVLYNGRDVSKAFGRKLTRRQLSSRDYLYLYDSIRLRPERQNDIDIFLHSGTRLLAHVGYLPPECPLSISRGIASTEPFHPPENYLSTVNKMARQHQINPSMLAGLIAQESGFDPESVSSARAIGLTQVTPIADQEIEKMRPSWPRDPRLNQLSPREIGSLIRKRGITGYRDWRLNPTQSIEGGALYISYLRDYWSAPDAQKVLSTFPQVDFNQVILASYNSGPYRVKGEIEKYGAQWLKSENLKEAFKYVQSVSSYCYHFAEATP